MTDEELEPKKDLTSLLWQWFGYVERYFSKQRHLSPLSALPEVIR